MLQATSQDMNVLFSVSQLFPPKAINHKAYKTHMSKLQNKGLHTGLSTAPDITNHQKLNDI